MAFFDKIGQTISNGVSSVSDTTKSLAGTAKLNSQINTNKNTIKETYQQIGEYCYNNREGAIDKEKLVPMFEEIDRLTLENKDLELKVKLAKGYVPCKNCGADVAVNTSFCANCGAKVVVPAPESEKTPEGKKRCLKCGNLEDEATKFCSSCGTKLPDVAPTTVVCPNCSATLPANMKFCSECGTKVDAPAPIAEEAPIVEETPAVAPVEEVAVAEETEIKGTPAPEAVVEEVVEPVAEEVAVVEGTSTPVIVEEAVAPAGQVCPNCGNKENDGMKFCSECGHKFEVAPVEAPVIEAPVIEETPAPVGNVCSGCGNTEPDGVKFCSQCGTKLGEVASPVAPAVVPEQPAPAQVPATEAPITVDNVSAADKVACEKCGNIEVKGTKFCSECGNKL